MVDLLVWHCAKEKVVAGCYLDELMYKLTDEVAKNTRDSERHVFSQLVTHYFFGYLLRPYELYACNDIPKGLRNDVADDAIVAFAAEYSIELVSEQRGVAADGAS